MNGKRSVIVSDALLAEARRLAGVRTSAAAVNAALREFIARHGEDAKGRDNGAAVPEKAQGGIENLMKLSEYMRESGWDDTGSRLLRERLARAGGKNI